MPVPLVPETPRVQQVLICRTPADNSMVFRVIYVDTAVGSDDGGRLNVAWLVNVSLQQVDPIQWQTCKRHTISMSMSMCLFTKSLQWLVRCSGNGICQINEVKLHRAWLALGLVTTTGRSTTPVFIQATQPGRPSVGRCTEYWRRFRPLLGKKRRVLRSSGPCYQDSRHDDFVAFDIAADQSCMA